MLSAKAQFPLGEFVRRLRGFSRRLAPEQHEIGLFRFIDFMAESNTSNGSLPSQWPTKAEAWGGSSRIVRHLGSGNQMDGAMIVAWLSPSKARGVRSRLRDDPEKFNAFLQSCCLKRARPLVVIFVRIAALLSKGYPPPEGSPIC